jgi:hypothetical protein
MGVCRAIVHSEIQSVYEGPSGNFRWELCEMYIGVPFGLDARCILA